LKKGVEYGRVPDYCKVAPYGGAWRKLKSVREIAALDSKNKNATVANKPPTGDRLVELSRPIGRIRDEDELCYHVTRISLIATGAESGMFHFRSRSARGLTTRCVLGPMSSERLNESLPDNDLVMRAAKLGRPIPDRGRAVHPLRDQQRRRRRRGDDPDLRRQHADGDAGAFTSGPRLPAQRPAARRAHRLARAVSALELVPRSARMRAMFGG
jgi:hypothetical protein